LDADFWKIPRMEEEIHPRR